MKLRNLTYSFLFLLLLSPVLSYLSFGLLGLYPIRVYFQAIICIYGIIFIILKYRNIKFPSFAIFALLFFFYVFTWSFFNGDLERRGIIAILVNNSYLPIFLILVVIYNTIYSEQFIRLTIKIFGVTVVLAFIFSLIQAYDMSFFNAWSLWNPERNLLVGDLYSDRRSSIFGYIDRNALGLSFIPLLSVLVGYKIFNDSPFIYRFLIMGAVIVLLSNARYIMIAFVLITFQYLIVQNNFIKAVSKYTISIFIVSIISLLVLNYIGYNFQYWYEDRLFQEGSYDRSTRYLAFINFMHFFPQYPILGNGSIADEEVIAASQAVGSSHIHVGYLSHLVAYGLAGCFLLFTCWILLLKRLYKTAKLSNYWGSFFAFIAFLFAFATFSMSSIFFYGLVFAFIFDKYINDMYEYNNNNI